MGPKLFIHVSISEISVNICYSFCGITRQLKLKGKVEEGSEDNSGKNKGNKTGERNEMEIEMAAVHESLVFFISSLVDTVKWRRMCKYFAKHQVG